MIFSNTLTLIQAVALIAGLVVSAALLLTATPESTGSKIQAPAKNGVWLQMSPGPYPWTTRYGILTTWRLETQRFNTV